MGPVRYEFIAHSVVFLIGCFFQVFSIESRQVLDLIKSLNETATEITGLQYTSGFINNTPTLLLEDSSRQIAVPDSVLLQALHLLKTHDEITFLANVKQELGDSGSILSFSSEVRRFLEVESSGRRDEIRFHYTHDQQIRVETFPYRLADNHWHHLALSISGAHVTLLVDCSKIYERVIQTVDREFTAGKLSLFIGQRNGQHALFRGALQDVRIVTDSHGYLIQCPDQNTDCPTCAQYQALEQKVKEMYNLYQNISLKLLQAEERITGLEQCECLRSCSDNGTVRKEGETWKRDKCAVCMCRNGSVECTNIECPPVECKNPVYRDEECCPLCLINCFYSGQYYDHGEGFSPKVCVTCTCNNGRMVCKRQDRARSCKPLNCPESERLQIAGECCPVCNGTDFCALGHDCHVNASCINLATRYACQCAPGFQGDGHYCQDINECAAEGGKSGHHCHSNTVCVNTIGSYTCQCATGHNRLDAYTCEEYDECLSNTHACHPNAKCTNMKGTYRCDCQEGYVGDGFHCESYCEGRCLNGGKCIAPNVCECRHGYIGPNCELDIDECALGISSCRGHSVCVNLPGWYRCDCLEGYHCNWPDNHYGSLCLDINECVGEGDSHTCHPSMQCVNTEGSYECSCKDRNSCLKNCLFEGQEYSNEDTWLSTMDKCLTCICQAGVTSCHKRECDCSAVDVDMDCCPHCNLSAQCLHQEFSSIYMQNKEKWTFQCQTCECLHGETDCWPLECPETPCQNHVQEEGDCCPRCIDDNPCIDPNLEVGGQDHSLKSCIYMDRHYKHGDSWLLESDPCTTCECKAGHICCAFNQTCSAEIGLPPVDPKNTLSLG